MKALDILKAVKEGSFIPYRQKNLLKLEEAIATIEDLESQRFALWMLLDNIDTAEDIAKSDDKLFRALCRNEYQNRWSIFKPKDKE